MVKTTKPLKVAIVGGGPGCKAIMDMIFAKKLGQLRMRLVGVACTNPRAVGYRYAQDKGIYTTRDYCDLFKLKDLNIIIELTGRQEVANEISRTKPDRITLMDHVAARLFWDIFQIEEKSIAERNRAQEMLQSARDGLEIRVKQRTAELSRSNALLKQEIAERKQSEKEYRNINVELNNFVRVVSHDLKNPIIAIQGFSSRLLKHYEEKLGERGQRYVEQIKVSARRMEVLVSDLLELSRIGRVVSAFKDVPSLEIVRNVTSALRDRLKENGIELVVADNLPTICCDGERMYQVFENLLVNAIKFTRVTKAPKIEIGYEDRGNSHEFYVRDNGVGIDPKHHRKVFEMFQRLKQIEDQEGTGLGLAIVDRIVKNHDGKVWVESEKGKGATFYFTLPKLA
ncbi:MAG: GHKL domain-containing protein [Deltaproteobacteria bacterium]|nr:GHKL domain-containing protein [Deltaproteobacteria bacterium]